MNSEITLKKQSDELKILYLLTISALIVFYVFDAATKVLLTSGSEFYRASILIRSFYEILFLFFIILYMNRTRAMFLIFILCFFIFFIIGQLLFRSNVNYPDYALGENIITFNKYFFPFVIYFSIYKLKDDLPRLTRCITFLEYIFIINSIAIFIGLATGADFLKSYADKIYRHGYNGFIPSQNESTLFYFLAVSLSYYKRYILGIKAKSFYIIVFSAMLLGTKGIYIFTILLLLYHLLFNSSLKYKILIAAVIVSAFFLAAHFILSDAGQQQFSYFYRGIENYGFFSMLISGRDLSLSDDIRHVTSDWTPINYIVGGLDMKRVYTELDFVDLFLFFGLAGSCIYLFMLFTTIFRFKKYTSFIVFTVFCYLTLAFFGGHFFTSALNALYLVVFSLYLKTGTTEYASAESHTT